MIGALRHAVRVVRSVLRERTKGRSPHWPALRRAWLASHGACAACGGARLLQVHHVKPYHLDPSMELDPTNLVTLCMSTCECHLRIGHGGDFEAYNPSVVADAADVLAVPAMRPATEARATQNREYALDHAESAP